MNLVQVLWSRPVLLSRGDKTWGGFASVQDFLAVWALSILSARRFFDKTTLVTDEWGRHAAEALKLPYDVYEVALEGLEVSPEFWNAGKFKAFLKHDKAFVYLDLDFILFEPLPARVLTAEIAAKRQESLDREAMFYRSALKFMLPREDLLPAMWQGRRIEDSARRALNSSFLSFRSLELVHSYARESLELLLNPDFLNIAIEASQRLGVKPWYFSVTVEQLALAFWCENYGMSPEFLGAAGENESKSYRHLIHTQKRDKLLLRGIMDELRKLEPQVLERIGTHAALLAQ